MASVFLTFRDLTKFVRSLNCKDVLYISVKCTDGSSLLFPATGINQGDGKIDLEINLEDIMALADEVQAMMKQSEEKRLAASELVKDHPGYGKKYTLWTRVGDTENNWYNDAATGSNSGLSGVEWNDDVRWSTKLVALKLGWVMFESGVNPNLDRSAKPLEFPAEYLEAYGINYLDVYGHLPKEKRLEMQERILQINREKLTQKLAEMTPKTRTELLADKLRLQKMKVSELSTSVKRKLVREYGAKVEDDLIWID